MRATGTLMCLASAAGFGAMTIFGKLAYGEGATVGTLLAVRFAIASLLLWGLLLTGGALRELRALSRRDVVAALALGAVGYAGQAATYFSALRRMDAAVLSLLLYTYPAIVAVAAAALGRERVDARRVIALLLTSAGLVLVLAAAGTGTLDPLGSALALGAAVIYSAYILVGDRAGLRVPALPLAALVCSGATVTLALGSAVLGQLRPGALTAAGWGWIACVAVVSTVGAIGLFFAALRRIGPTRTAIVSTAEPLVTVVLAYLVFGETLAPLQQAGGVLVLGGVLALHVRLRRRRVAAQPA